MALSKALHHIEFFGIKRQLLPCTSHALPTHCKSIVALSLALAVSSKLQRIAAIALHACLAPQSCGLDQLACCLSALLCLQTGLGQRTKKIICATVKCPQLQVLMLQQLARQCTACNVQSCRESDRRNSLLSGPLCLVRTHTHVQMRGHRSKLEMFGVSAWCG